MCPICGDPRPLPLRFPEAIHGHLVGGDTLTEAPIHARWPERVASSCPGCRATLSSTEPLDRCPHCGQRPSPNFAEAVTLPSGILPFLFEGNEAHDAMTAELRRLNLRPRPEPLTPVYLPWLLVSSQVSATYEGQAGYEIEEGTGDHRRVRIEWSQSIGKVEHPWDNRGGCASIGLPRDLGERLAPWDFAFTERADLDAIGDTPVEHIHRELDGVFTWAVPQFREELRRAALNDIPATHRRLNSVFPERHDERVRLILVPAWLGRTDAGVRFAINARTGEVVVEGHRGAEPEESEIELEPDTGRSLRLAATVAAVAGIAALIGWLMLAKG